MNFRPSHIPFGRLVDWVEERLTAEERAQLQRHLAECHQCHQEAARLQHIFQVARSDVDMDPRPEVVDRALRIFPLRPGPVATPLLQRIVAVLRLDSVQRSPVMGVRSAAATPRRLLYSAGDYDLDMRLTPQENTEEWVITGQVLGSDNPTGHVVLQGTSEATQAPLATPGEFMLPPVPAGDYTLVVHLPDCAIAVESLKLGA